jgi:hypothetical protein
MERHELRELVEDTPEALKPRYQPDRRRRPIRAGTRLRFVDAPGNRWRKILCQVLRAALLRRQGKPR